jgi:hypothetical protein
LTNPSEYSHGHIWKLKVLLRKRQESNAILRIKGYSIECMFPKAESGRVLAY